MQASPRARRRRLVGLTAAVAATAGLAVVVSSVLASSPHQSRVRRIKLIEHHPHATFVDTGKPGPSPGDRNVINAEVLNPHGHQIGHLGFDCTVTSADKPIQGVCHGALTLPDGQISGESAFGPSGEAHRQAITGGTRHYRGARGQFLVGKDSGRGTHVTVELLR
jgi:hypothetical protein